MRASLVLKGKNLFEVALKLPNYGKGQRVQRATWSEGSYWTLTEVLPSPDGAHGKAYGILTWSGRPQSEEPKKVLGPLKKVWRSMDKRAVEWVTLEKPPLVAKPPEAVASEAA